ncbi:hypothetical protein BX666DRAFT_1935640 [Dichotomocladium elegans]|nr:hypothetical protein BX666DRAFT_1935640 [Dichotomocladium elegans]
MNKTRKKGRDPLLSLLLLAARSHGRFTYPIIVKIICPAFPSGCLRYLVPFGDRLARISYFLVCWILSIQCQYLITVKARHDCKKRKG